MLLKEIELFKSVLHDLDDGIVIADNDGRFLLFNAAAEKMLGKGAKDLNPVEWSSNYGCFLPDRTTPFPANRLPLYRALEGEEIENELIFIKNPARTDGLWINVNGKPLRDYDNEICGGVVIFRDVSDQREAEESLQSISRRLATLVENQNSGILIESETGQVLQVNQAFCNLVGLTTPPSEIIGQNCATYVDQVKRLFRDPDQFIDRKRRIIDEKSIVMNEELALVDGRTYQRDYFPIFVNKSYRGHLWHYRDISERRQIKKKIDIYERLSAALEQTADSVVITNKKGIIEYVNPAFEETTGFSHDEVIGKTPSILKSGKHDDGFYRKMWQEVMAGRFFRCTIINRRKNGELYWAEQTISPMKDDAGEITHFVSVLKDITELIEKKEQEAKLNLAREVQQRFYGITTSVPGFDIAGAAYPAEETGGDYFDFVRLPDGTLCIVVGDVSGHGIGPALVMAETRAYLRSVATDGLAADQILSRVNRFLVPDLDNGQFVTLLLGCLNPETKILKFASAGHVPGYLIDGSGEVVSVLGGTGPPLGLFADAKFSSDEISLTVPGQTVLLPTDGVTDAMTRHDVPFGTERTIKYIGDHRHQSALHIVEGLYQATKDFAGNRRQFDDITAVVIRVI